MPPTEHVERQIAVTVVVTVEEPSLLISVQRIIGRIKIEDDLLRSSHLRLQEQVDRKSLDCYRIMTDLVIARRLQLAQLQPVERRLPSDRRAIVAPRLEFTCQYRHQRIVAQFVMVIEILIAKRDPEHPLANEGHLKAEPLRSAGDRSAADAGLQARRSNEQA